MALQQERRDIISIYYTEDTTFSSGCTFYPYTVPFLLTAEVNNLDAADSSKAVATSPGYLRYPAPTVYLTNDRSNLTNELPLMSLLFMIWPSFARDNGRTSL
ncbi:hypothetical protein HRI_001278400 [Hibiscus trionum]|uniref:Uncharacterized protein n=1 Tax=Hibiscus trionum TaxID=183268 RepID=A0A9W7HF18_HIBTR|nr:hypothetical protein HRI_001278400 [Hibiscus trionum]